MARKLAPAPLPAAAPADPFAAILAGLVALIEAHRATATSGPALALLVALDWLVGLASSTDPAAQLAAAVAPPAAPAPSARLCAGQVEMAHSILDALTELSDAAQHFGAVNTILTGMEHECAGPASFGLVNAFGAMRGLHVRLDWIGATLQAAAQTLTGTRQGEPMVVHVLALQSLIEGGACGLGVAEKFSKPATVKR